jgi:DNA-directed RNA polymerase subunit M/transcription elongation factor TFIIS
MDFCPRCGSVLQADNNMLTCSCGYRGTPQERVVRELSSQQKPVEIVDQSTHLLAVHDHVCSKCGYEKAQLVTKGVWYTDEDDHFSYVCGKCGHHDKIDAKTK